MKHNDHKGLAEAVYYSKINRIDYLVNVNNELMKELELSEKRRYDILSGVE